MTPPAPPIAAGGSDLRTGFYCYALAACTMVERDVRFLLQRLCVELGFCLPPDTNDRLVANVPTTIDEFTKVVFTEEGLDPMAADKHLYRQVKEVVAQAFRESAGRLSDDA